MANALPEELHFEVFGWCSLLLMICKLCIKCSKLA